MKCENCSVNIDNKFKFAIKENKCPACGKDIMNQAKLASYLSLKTLLDNTISDKSIDADKLVSIIMANFEIKQIFKGELPESKKPNTVEIDSEIVEEDSGPIFDEDGIKYEKVDKKKAQNMLQKMRDEALSEALSNREDLDFTDDELLLLKDGSVRQEQVLQAKQNSSRQKIHGGGESSFKRTT